MVDQVGPGHGLSDMMDRVIDYCEMDILFCQLMAAVQEEKPRQYLRCEADL